MKNLLFFLFLLSALNSNGQRTLFILDPSTEEPVPFAKIRPDAGNPVLSDIDGAFILQPDVKSIDIRAVGYRDTVILIYKIEGEIVFLTPEVKQLEEVVVLPGENPAHRIIHKAVQERKNNDPLRNDAFMYETYSKFIFDINRAALDSIPENTTDTNLIDMRSFFEAQHLFILESSSIRTFMPPDKDKEEITAYKVSGFKNPLFSTFANEMQSFSFYDEQFSILGTNYINPISPGSTRRYLFVMEDTTVVGQDTTFTIFYRPRKNKNFDGLTGRLYINTNGYAIEKVTASPYLSEDLGQVTIIQEYQLVNDIKWFPSKLSTHIDLESFQINPDVPASYLQGKGNTYIRNISLNPDNINKRQFNQISIITREDAAEKEDEEWDSLRVYSITDREQRTYEMIDSTSEANHLEDKLDRFTTLLDGKLPIGKFDLDLTKLINYDYYEGYRLGAGLETSDRLMKRFKVGGYYGWATKDKESKYGGFAQYYFSRKQGVLLRVSYHQDLLERGGTNFRNEPFSLQSPALMRHFFIENMEKQRLAEVLFSFNMRPNIQLSLIGNYQRLWYTYNYQFDESGIFQSTDPNLTIDVAETGIEVMWSLKEKYMLLGNKLIPKGSKYPRIHFQAFKGWSGWFESEIDYYRFYIDISHQISFRGAGKLYWSLVASQTIGDVPLTLMQRGNGTGRPWNFSVMNTFETLSPSMFFHSKQVALYTRFFFPSIKTKAKWNDPQFGVHHAIGFGEMDHKEYHSITFKTMDNGYYEGGLILNNLFVTGFTGVGIAAFYNYGVYADPNWKKNIVPKISISLSL